MMLTTETSIQGDSRSLEAIAKMASVERVDLLRQIYNGAEDTAASFRVTGAAVMSELVERGLEGEFDSAVLPAADHSPLSLDSALDLMEKAVSSLEAIEPRDLAVVLEPAHQVDRAEYEAPLRRVLDHLVVSSPAEQQQAVIQLLGRFHSFWASAVEAQGAEVA